MPEEATTPVTPLPLTADSTASPVTIPFPTRKVQVYGITAAELEQLENRSGSLVWTFFGIAFGSCLTALALIFSAESISGSALLVLTALLASSGFLAVLCFGLASRDQIRVRQLMKSIRSDPGRLLADARVVLALLEATGTQKT
jgi:hypothetical protein